MPQTRDKINGMEDNFYEGLKIVFDASPKYYLKNFLNQR
jgi:hypothetical protein